EKMWGIEVLAAVGPNADAFGPPAATGFDFVNQFLPSIPHIFSVTASKRVLRALKRHVQLSRKPYPPLSQLGASGREECVGWGLME
ncbi:MAG: hypothetical protein ACLRTM_23680, partial [Clostridium sp.]